MKEYSSREISEFKRTAQNVWPDLVKKQKLETKLAELQEELNHVNNKIALKEAFVLNETGYHVFELIDRKVTRTTVLDEEGFPKKDEKGNTVTITNVEYSLKYPDTIIPVSTEEELPVSETAESVDVENVEE